MGSAWFIAMMLGFVIFMTGVVWTNVVVYKMMKVVDEDLPPSERVAPWRVLGKGAAFYKPAERYRKKYSDGPLDKSMTFGYRLCIVGGILLFGGAMIGKVSPFH